MLGQLNGRLTSVGRPATQVFDRVVADGALRGARSWDGLASASRASTQVLATSRMRTPRCPWSRANPLRRNCSGAVQNGNWNEGSALKGNKAQGSIGSNASGNTGRRQRTFWRSKAMKSSIGRLETTDKSNGMMATAAVTRCGFQKGENFEGCEERAWERVGGPTDVETQRTGGPARNGSNPMTGYRMQQACRAVRGVNHRSREERHGWKVSDM